MGDPATSQYQQTAQWQDRPEGRQMPDIETIRTWEGRTLLDRDGGRIGTIDAIYLDDQTGQPEWALVNTGLFGTKSSFVPLAQAFQSDNDVVASYDKQLVSDAPRVGPDGHLSEDEGQLWRHYGLDYDTTKPTTDEEHGRVRLRKFEVQHENGKFGRHARRGRR
jgi:hypothetical protein